MRDHLESSAQLEALRDRLASDSPDHQKAALRALLCDLVDGMTISFEDAAQIAGHAFVAPAEVPAGLRLAFAELVLRLAYPDDWPFA